LRSFSLVDDKWPKEFFLWMISDGGINPVDIGLGVGGG